MSARYTNIADWGERVSRLEFKRRYGCPFKGDGWYLLSIAGGEDVRPAAILALDEDGVINAGGSFRTRRWRSGRSRRGVKKIDFTISSYPCAQ